MRKNRQILTSLISITLLISPIPLAVSAPNVVSGGPCPKQNFQQESGGKIYTCLKLGSKLKWDKGTPTKVTTQIVTPTPTPTVAPTFKPLFSLDIKPVLTMTQWSQTPSYYLSGEFKRWNVTSGYVEISLPAFDKLNSAAEYFAVIEPEWVYNSSCVSGDVPLTLYSRKIDNPSSNKLERVLPSKGYSGLRSVYFKIPSFPITFKCSFQSKKSYSIEIYETFTPDRLIRAKSPKFEFTTPELTKPVESQPTPAPTINTTIRAVANAFCAPEGEVARAADESIYICKRSASDGTLRWSN